MHEEIVGAKGMKAYYFTSEDVLFNHRLKEDVLIERRFHVELSKSFIESISFIFFLPFVEEKLTAEMFSRLRPPFSMLFFYLIFAQDERRLCLCERPVLRF